MKTNRMKKFTPYFYILPTFIILAVVIVIPIIYVIIQSFYTTFANESVFVGLRNYKMAFEDELLLTALKNNLKLFLCVPILTVLSLAIASILYNKIRGWRFYKKRYFLFRTYLAISGCGHCIFIFTAVQRSYQFYFADNRVGEYGVGLVGRSEFGIPECGNSYYVEADRFRSCFVFGENDVNR